MKLKKRNIFIFIVIIAILLYFAKGFLGGNSNANVVAPEIQTIEKGNLELSYEVTGSVVSKKEVLIFSSVPGEVKKINFRLGDEVKKGDILLELDSTIIQEANSNAEKLRINLNQRKKEYSDLYEIYKVGGASKNEVDKARDAVRVAELELQNLLNSNSNYSSQIVSTVSGVITEVNADENLKVDQSKYLYKIVDVENLRVSVEIPNGKVKNLQIGQEVTIKSDSLQEGSVITAHISEISKISTRDAQFNDAVTKVYIDLDKDSGLKPGDDVKVNIIYDKVNDATLVSVLDIETDFNTNKTYVYKIDENGKVKREEVVLGKTNNTYYEVKSGLNPGDSIINNISKQYKEGDKVK